MQHLAANAPQQSSKPNRLMSSAPTPADRHHAAPPAALGPLKGASCRQAADPTTPQRPAATAPRSAARPAAATACRLLRAGRAERYLELPACGEFIHISVNEYVYSQLPAARRAASALAVTQHGGHTAQHERLQQGLYMLRQGDGPAKNMHGSNCAVVQCQDRVDV